MLKSLVNDLEVMVQQGVITPETAGNIQHWYASRKESNPNRLILVFGVLGVLLVGSGISLLVAHNWDDMSAPLKTFFAFLPLLIGQVWAGYTLLKNRENEMHREMSAGWLALAIGTSIALVSQIYHLPGNMADFLLTWLLLGLPLVYLLRSSVASLLFIAGATWYGTEVGYGYNQYENNNWIYFVLIAAVMPHYYLLFRSRPSGWFSVLHHYAVPVSLLICLGILAENKNGDWMWVAYMSMLGIFYLVGYTLTLKNVTGLSNAYRIIGWTGCLLLLFMGSFHDFWKEFNSNYGSVWLSMGGLSFFTAIGLSLAGLAFFIFLYRRKSFSNIDPVAPAFLLYLTLFVLGGSSPYIASLLTNIYLLGTGVLLLVRGQKQERLAILNLGLGMIAVLAICRFFDTDLSFIIRGVMFILVGVGFVYFNYQLIQKKKKV